MLVQDFIGQVKYVLFDMDGTLLDTNQMKLQAMTQALSDLELGFEFLHHFKRNFGWTREKHFDYLRECFLDNDASLTQKYRNRYEQNLQDNSLNIEFCTGAKELVESLASRDVGMSVVTGSAQQDAREILVAKGVSQYFDEILGSPNIKTQSVAHIIKKYGHKNKDCVLVGDSMNDLLAAENNHIPFIYAAKYTLADQDRIRARVRNGGHWEVYNLHELEAVSA
jgi:phosphoglycolate phosphatase